MYMIRRERYVNNTCVYIYRSHEVVKKLNHIETEKTTITMTMIKTMIKTSTILLIIGEKIMKNKIVPKDQSVEVLGVWRYINRLEFFS